MKRPALPPARVTLALCVASGPLCVVLVQVHSIAFWQVHALGWWTGLGWSIALELVGLLFWFQPWNRGLSWRWVGAVATLVLLAGPLYELSAPLFAEGAAQDSRAARIAELTREQDTCLRLTEQGRNFGPCIARTSGELSRLRGKQQPSIAGNNRGTAQHQTWQSVAVILLQVASVVIFYIAIVLSITAVSRHYHQPGEQGKRPEETDAGEQGNGGEPAGETPTAAGHERTGNKETINSPPPNAQNEPLAAPEPDAPTDPADLPLPPSAPQEGSGDAVLLLVDALQSAVSQRIARGESQNGVAESIGISKKAMSQLMNHQTLRARRQKTLGLRALRSLGLILGAPIPPALRGDPGIPNAQNGLDN